jgi:hypothetical protein
MQKQTTRIYNEKYVKLSANGSPALRHSGVDVLRAATSPGAMWKRVGLVDNTERVNFPLTPEIHRSGPSPFYRADSIPDMERMKGLQRACAEANFKNGSFGSRPLVLLAMIFDYWKRHKDPVAGVR